MQLINLQVVAQSAAVAGAVAASGQATAPHGDGSAAPDNPFAAAASRRSADAERAGGSAAAAAAEQAAGSDAIPASPFADTSPKPAGSASIRKPPSISDAYALFDDTPDHGSPKAGDLACDARLPAADWRPSLAKASLSNMCVI